MNSMDKPPDSGSVTPPLATQLVQAELKHSELPTHSRELIIANLRKLSDSLSTFQRCLTDLQLYIDSSCNSIHSSSMLILSPPAASIPEPEPSREFDPSEEEEEEEGEEEGEGEVGEEEEEEGEGVGVKTPLCPELASLCKAMNNRGLKNYMVKHLSDIKRLREQVRKALKLLENPAMLVLKCLDKFYLQGSRAYVEGSHMIPQREASVLALECLLLTMAEGERVVEIAEGVKKDAKQAALAWKERLISEGGVRKACDMDARGLLLLLGCFGIPSYGFLHSDIRSLLQLEFLVPSGDQVFSWNISQN